MSDLETSLQRHYGAALSILIKKTGCLQQAEDALQGACLKALTYWQKELPANPAGWLVKVAYHLVIDEYRKQGTRKSQELSFDSERLTVNSPFNPEVEDMPIGSEVELNDGFDDNILQLIFMCCHPALAQEQQIALTLKLVMGFETKEIAKAFLIPEKTLEQRITRAKRKIAANNIELSLPSSDKLALRLPTVHQTLYLIFNEGYHNSYSNDLFSAVLCEQAIMLMRSLCRMFRSQSDSLALLSLMLFIDARSPARSKDVFISLEQQDRQLWKKSLIAQADILLKKSLALGRVSHFHIQAAINGLHSMANSFAETDWAQVCLLYQKLLQYQNSPVVLLNKAVAHMMLNQWEESRAILSLIKPELENYGFYYVVDAKLLEHDMHFEGAIHSFSKAIEFAHNEKEKQFYRREIKRLTQIIV